MKFSDSSKCQNCELNRADKLVNLMISISEIFTWYSNSELIIGLIPSIVHMVMMMMISVVNHSNDGQINRWINQTSMIIT